MSHTNVLPIPRDLRVRFISDRQIIIAWNVNINPKSEYTSIVSISQCSNAKIQIIESKNEAIISQLEPETRYWFAVQLIKHSNSSNNTITTNKSQFSDKLYVTTNSKPWDWNTTYYNDDYFLTYGGMTDVQAECYVYGTTIRFQPPCEPDVWHGYVYHLFFLNGKFEVNGKGSTCVSIGDGSNSNTCNSLNFGENVYFPYPAQCGGVRMFDDGVIHAYTICSRRERQFCSTELRVFVESSNVYKRDGQGCLQIKVNGERPYKQGRLKILYIDTLKLFENKKEYVKDIVSTIKEMTKCKNKKLKKKKMKNKNTNNNNGNKNKRITNVRLGNRNELENNINSTNENKNKNANQRKNQNGYDSSDTSKSIWLDFNSHHTYNQFIQAMIETREIAQEKANLIENHSNIIDCNRVIWFRCKYGKIDRSVDPQKDYLDLIGDLCHTDESRRFRDWQNTIILVGFRVLPPQIISSIGGYRSATFKLFEKLENIIHKQKYELYVLEKYFDRNKKCICKRKHKPRWVSCNKEWNINLTRNNGIHELEIGIDIGIKGGSNFSNTTILEQFGECLTTTVNVEITGNSFQQHFIRQINGASEQNDINRIIEILKYCDKFETLNATDDVKIKYFDRLIGKRILKLYTKEEILIESGLVRPLCGNEIKQALMNNRQLLEKPELMKYYASIIDESSPNGKQNLGKLVDCWCSFETIFSTLRQANVSNVTIYQVINSRLQQACGVSLGTSKNGNKSTNGNKKNNQDLDSDDEMEDFDIDVDNVTKLKQENEILKKKYNELDQDYNGLLFDTKKLRKTAINGRPDVNYGDIDIVWNKGINSKDYGARTKDCNEYKKILNELCTKESLNSKEWHLEIDSVKNGPSTDEEIYQLFLAKNGESKPKPLVIIRSKKNNNSNSNSNSNDNSNYKYIWIPIDEVLEVKKVENCELLPFLNGQNGLFAKIDIPKGTPIQQYFGIESGKKEWHQQYDGTDQRQQHESYLFEQCFTHSNVSESCIDGNAKKRRKLNPYRLRSSTQNGDDDESGNENENKQLESDDVKQLRIEAQQLELRLFEEGKIRSLYIDPKAIKGGRLPDNHFASRCNDARKNIQSNRWTKIDKETKNCTFRSLRINRWPSVFLETTRDIKKGEQLFTDYGKKYGCLMEREKEVREQKKMNQEFIDSKIVNRSKLDRVPSFNLIETEN